MDSQHDGSADEPLDTQVPLGGGTQQAAGDAHMALSEEEDAGTVINIGMASDALAN